MSAGQRRKVFTTRQDPDATRAPDLVNRNFTADRPDALWVTDLTYVPTRSGMAYVCFIVDAFSRLIVGWRVASNMRTDMVLDALEMARRSRGSRRLVGLVTHSDAGSPVHVRALHRTTRRDRRPADRSAPSRTATTTPWPRQRTGSTRPSASTGPTPREPWDDVDELELATLSWVHWFNDDRLHGHCGDIPPAEFEAAFYAAQQTAPPGLETNRPSLHQTQGDSVTINADPADVAASDGIIRQLVGLGRGRRPRPLRLRAFGWRSTPA